MNFITDIQLDSGSKQISSLKDIQLWSDSDDEKTTDYIKRNIHGKHKKVSIINLDLLPIYLVHGKPLRVFTENEATLSFFKKTLLKNQKNVGLLTQNTSNEHLYIVLYIELSRDELMLQSLIIDLNKLENITENYNQYEYSYFVGNSLKLELPKHDVFDRVLKLKNKSNSFVVQKSQPIKESQLSSQPLKDKEKIKQSVQKIILSGLRIRGITSNYKDYYQITFKSTLFALKKFEDSQKKIQLNDIQNIVEKLLQIFVDLDE